MKAGGAVLVSYEDSPSLVIVDPVSAALADADTSQTGPALSTPSLTRGGDRRLRCVAGGARHQICAQPGNGRTRPRSRGRRRFRGRPRGVLTLVPDPAAREDGSAWMYEVRGPASLAPGVPLTLEGIRRVQLPAGSAGRWPFSFDESVAQIMHVDSGTVIAGTPPS